MKSVPVNRRQNRKDNAMTFSTKQEPAARLEVFRFEGSQQLQQAVDQGATRINEQETQHDQDSRLACSVLSAVHIGEAFSSDSLGTIDNSCSALLRADSKFRFNAGPEEKQCSDRPLRGQVLMENTKA